MKKMKTFAMSVVLALAISSFCHAQTQGRPGGLSASSLLQGISNVASNLSRRDTQLGKSRDAAIWQQWADLFQTQSRQAPPQMSAADLAALQVNALQKLVVILEARGQVPAARLYRASAAMWQDMANQIARGGDVIVRFPECREHPGKTRRVSPLPTPPLRNRLSSRRATTAPPPSCWRCSRRRVSVRRLARPHSTQPRPRATR